MQKTALITGSTSGIGKATAHALAQRGWQVIIHGRDEVKGQDTVESIKNSTNNSQISFLKADLSSLQEVKQLADQVKEQFPRLNVLINNAGTFSRKRIMTNEGLELTWVVNYLSRFLLVNELSELLAQNGPSRIIDVSGRYHKKGKIRFDTTFLPDEYTWSRANNQSKLANVLHTFYLAQAVLPPQITVNTLHPGAVNTGALLRSDDFSILAKWLYRLVSPVMKRPEQGAATAVFLATADSVQEISGAYFVNKKTAKSSQASREGWLQERLWKHSQQMVEKVLYDGRYIK